MALYLMVFMGGTPIGSPFIGWVGEQFGARWTLIGGGGADHPRRAALGRASSPAAAALLPAPAWSPAVRRPLAEPVDSRGMNPRYRRLVIPVALGGLILIVVIAALAEVGRRWPSRCPGPWRGCAAPSSTTSTWCGPSPPAAGGGSPSRGGAASSCGTSTSRPAAASRSRRTTTPRRHVANHAGRRGEVARRAARRAVRQLARRDHDADPPAAGDQEGPGAAALRPSAASRWRPTRSHDQAKERLLPEDDPVLRALGISDAAGPDQAVAAGEVPPGRGVPARARRPRSTTPPRSGQAAHADRRRTRCGWSTSAAATPT